MKWPIRILRGDPSRFEFGHHLPGYEQLHYGYKRDDYVRVPGSEMSVHVAKWLHWVIMTPERIWRHVLCRLWLDRLTFQYERGYEDGLYEGLNNADAYKSMSHEERAQLGEPFRAAEEARQQANRELDDLHRATILAMEAKP